MTETSEKIVTDVKIPHQTEVEYRGATFISHELPVNPNNRATYVVPVYREFGEGNVVNLLESLSSQDISKDEMEVVLLINNRSSDASRQSDAYMDNQLTMRVLSAVQDGSELPSELSQEDKDRLQKVIDSGLRVNYVDMSSKGVNEVVIGDIRNAGIGIVNRRSKDTLAKDDGVVFNFDADTIVDSGFTKAVLTEIDNGADMVVTNWEWKISADAPTRLVLDRNYFTFLDAYSQSEKAISCFGFVVGSPRISSKLKVLEDIKGFPSVASGEDYGLITRGAARAFRGDFRLRVIPDLFIQTAFRERPDNPSNFDSKLISEIDTSGSHEAGLKVLNNFWREWFVGKITSMRKADANELPRRFREYVEELLPYSLDKLEDVDFNGLETMNSKDVKALETWVNELFDHLDMSSRNPVFTLPNALVTILRTELPESEFEKYANLVEEIVGRNSSDIDRETPFIEEAVRIGVRTLVDADDADYIGTYLYNAAYYQAFNLMGLQSVSGNDLPGFRKVYDTFTQGRNIYELGDEDLERAISYLGYEVDVNKIEELFAHPVSNSKAK